MTVSVTTTGITSTIANTNLTLAEIVTNVCLEVGISNPSTIVGNSNKTASELLNMVTKACEELCRRFDWGDLLTTDEITGTGGNVEYALATDFLRLASGTAVTLSGAPIRGGISSDEWLTLPDGDGTPKYFRIKGRAISFYPNLSSGSVVKVRYVSKYFTDAGRDDFTADDDKVLVPHQLVEKGVIWRWRRHRGEDYEDYMAEYEAALTDYAEYDQRGRTP